MAVSRLFNIRPQYEDGNGNPAVGYRLFFYINGSSTKQNTYNASDGASANSNPIVLNANGEPGTEIWGTVGAGYKIGLAAPGADDPPAAFVWTEDNVSPVESATSGAAISEWVTGATATYVSATTFRLVGDVRTTYHIGRRIKFVCTGGTGYARISNSTFATGNTTVTLVNDTIALDSGLSAVSYGVLSAINTSSPTLSDDYFKITQAASGSTSVQFELGPLSPGSARKIYTGNTDFAISGGWDFDNLTLDYTFLSGAPNRIRISLREGSGSIPTADAPAFVRFRDGADTTGKYDVVKVSAQTDYTLGNGSTYGLVNGQPFRLYIVAINNGGTVILGVYNPLLISGGTYHHKALDEKLQTAATSGHDTTTADNAHVVYSTANVGSEPFRILGYIEGVEATAGTWSAGMTFIQEVTPGTPRSGEVIQRKFQMTDAAATTANTGIFSTAVPTTSDGAQFMSDSITPLSASNLIVCTAHSSLYNNNGQDFTLGLVVTKESATNIVATASATSAGGNSGVQLQLKYASPARTTASGTYNIRGWGNAAGTTYFNASPANSPLFGSTKKAWMELEEIFV